MLKPYKDGTYRPYGNITRGELSRMLYQAYRWRFGSGKLVKQNESTWKARVNEIITTKLPKNKKGLYIAMRMGDNALYSDAIDKLNGTNYQQKTELYSSSSQYKIRLFNVSSDETTTFLIKSARRNSDNDKYVKKWYDVVYRLYDGPNTNYHKAKYIHDIIVASGKYVDFDVVKYGNLQAVVKYGNNDFEKPISITKGTGSTCQAYAITFKELCDKFGIPCVYVSGVADGGVAHAWNKVYIDGKWYNVDCTWDDPKVKGKDVTFTGYEHYGNFLRSDAYFAKRRKQDKEYVRYKANSDYIK